MRLDRVAVIGAGAWGTALAQAAALAGRDVMLVARGAAAADEINERHTNSQHLAGQVLSPTIRAMTRYEGADLVILAVPAQASRAALTGLSLEGVPVVLTAKGLEQGSLKRQSEVLAE